MDIMREKVKVQVRKQIRKLRRTISQKRAEAKRRKGIVRKVEEAKSILPEARELSKELGIPLEEAKIYVMEQRKRERRKQKVRAVKEKAETTFGFMSEVGNVALWNARRMMYEPMLFRDWYQPEPKKRRKKPKKKTKRKK